MEYVDGQTLLAVLQERGPLELQEALEIASQFMVGLEAIHQAGLIHRDIKPENIMLTRAGRVVLMDFGLARDEESSTRTVAGTPAYMAPEQAAGLQVDARADVYSAGIVLAEMVNPGGIRDPESRKSIWEGLRSDPQQLPDTPWAPVIEKAVAKERDLRYDSAHSLIRALEEVTLRVAGAEDLRPYPGLEVFTANDAEYFFGREAEVEQLWRKLEGPARLLAMVGPSGAGKSSFVRAGLLPAKPESWQALIATPGSRPFTSLAQALLPELQSDANALEDLLRFEEPEVAVGLLTVWRRRRRHGLLVIDQFEELFTLNPDEVQERFADLLHRLALEAQVHVLLTMRDDFLFHCHRFEVLQPVFSEITPLGPPTGAALRRAVVQPALKCGYRFEDEALVEAMISEVGDERGTLPLIAFACAQLWQHRDRDQGLLTQAAYDEIGGVIGALAQHAEATLKGIGSQRTPMVRELFRNLVTSQGTRAPRNRGELLSVFSEEERETVDTILDALVDARLLVSYEAKSEPEEGVHR
jgi:serine/threonine protein kinase